MISLFLNICRVDFVCKYFPIRQLLSVPLLCVVFLSAQNECVFSSICGDPILWAVGAFSHQAYLHMQSFPCDDGNWIIKWFVLMQLLATIGNEM